MLKINIILICLLNHYKIKPYILMSYDVTFFLCQIMIMWYSIKYFIQDMFSGKNVENEFTIIKFI